MLSYILTGIISGSFGALMMGLLAGASKNNQCRECLKNYESIIKAREDSKSIA